MEQWEQLGNVQYSTIASFQHSAFNPGHCCAERATFCGHHPDQRRGPHGIHIDRIVAVSKRRCLVVFVLIVLLVLWRTVAILSRLSIPRTSGETRSVRSWLIRVGSALYTDGKSGPLVVQEATHAFHAFSPLAGRPFDNRNTSKLAR